MPKILVIDDDPLVRSTIARVLRRESYDFELAGEGSRGLELFESEQPDLVITDLIMPGKEGIETIRAIREMRPDAKIIAISGGGRFGNTEFLTLAAKLGACEVIAKPFEPSELIESVSRCLSSAK